MLGSGEKRLYHDSITRIIKEGEFIVEKGATVRECAKVFGVSKSTVHNDVVKKLIYHNSDLYERVKEVLLINLNERHIRGGIATRNKYKRK